MKRLSQCLALVLTLSGGLQLRGADPFSGITCVISGVTNSFSIRPLAVLTDEKQLEMFALGGDPRRPASIRIHLPAAREGVFGLRDTPGLLLDYSAMIFSSSLEDQYGVSGNTPGSAVEVTLLKMGRIGEPVEGRFSGVLRNHLGRELVITNGTFSLTLTNSEPKK